MDETRASGSLSCSIDDKRIKGEVSGVYSYGYGRPIVHTTADLQVQSKQFPEASRKLLLETQDLVHRWLSDRRLDLMLYRERGEKTEDKVELVIETRRPWKKSSDDIYRGTYRLSVSHSDPKTGKTVPFNLNGKVGCWIDD